MRFPWPFTPLEPGEIDNFGFDFTPDMGPATLVSTSWACYLAPYQDATLDPDPQSHILSTSISTQVTRTDPVTGDQELIPGNFSIASVGGFPVGAVGVVYVLEATVTLSDGRVLTNGALVECAPSPPP